MKISIVFLSVVLLAFCGGSKNNISPAANRHEKESFAEEAHAHGELGHTHAAGEKQTLTHDQEEGEEHEHEEIHISPKQQKEWGIVVDSPTSQNISSRVSLPGNLTLNANKTAYITSFVHGQVSALLADLGNRVRENQALITINSPDFGKAQADFLETRAALNLSQQEYERAKRLLGEKAIEEKEYLRRKAEYERFSTEYGALGSLLHSYGITHEQIDELIAKCDALEDKKYKCEIADPNLPVRSPLSGTVIFRNAILGEHIEPERILFTVSNLNTLWAILDAYEKDIPTITPESRVHILSPLYPDTKFPGRITYISDTIDEKLRTIKVRVEVQNKEGLLKPNMYIQGVVENRAENKEILTVPEEAIQNMDGEKIVFVMENDNIFVPRHIQLGNAIGDQRIVAGGLSKGDRLVLKGAFTIKTELTKGTFGHQHVH
jgi:cobalt-zinc-cadmium efflux system membrane fusion protein